MANVRNVTFEEYAKEKRDDSLKSGYRHVGFENVPGRPKPYMAQLYGHGPQANKASRAWHGPHRAEAIEALRDAYEQERGSGVMALPVLPEVDLPRVTIANLVSGLDNDADRRQQITRVPREYEQKDGKMVVYIRANIVPCTDRAFALKTGKCTRKQRVAAIFAYGGDTVELDAFVVDSLEEADKLERYARNLIDSVLRDHYPRAVAVSGRRRREARLLDPGKTVSLSKLRAFVAGVEWKP